MAVPEIRIRPGNTRSVRGDGAFVLYWMIAARRPDWNFGLDRAVEWAQELKKPLVVLEALRSGYEWASPRLHRFVLDGMELHRRRFRGSAIRYFPYVEPEPGAGKGLLEALAREAALVVTDDFHCLFLPRMVAAAGEKLAVRLEVVDSNGLLPLRATDRAFPTAHAFRRFLQKELPAHLEAAPHPSPLRFKLPRVSVPGAITNRWPEWRLEGIATIPLTHDVPPADLAGGAAKALRAWRRFRDGRLDGYADRRNLPGEDGASGLSPHLHFGHISPHRIFRELAEREEWEPGRLSPDTSGPRRGWWGMSEPAEAFLDQLVTWRELGFNGCVHMEGYDRYRSLPDWARETLEDHASDEREHVYSLAQFEAAETHDGIWNAAQRQLVREGKIHNYLRMLWGKKILEWTKTPRRALEIMIELNNKYALDGRDPNSYSSIFWVLGRYDRAWGPERPVFGKVRYMSSENTAKKFPMGDYLASYAQ